MLIRPELQALRGNDAPQRHAQAALHALVADWRRSGAGAGLDAMLLRYSNGEPLAQLPLLARLFVPGATAALGLCQNLLARCANGLAAEPWGQVPLRHKLDDTTATLVVAATGTAALVLQAIDGAGLSRRPRAHTVSFSPGETHDHVLHGQAAGRQIVLQHECELAAELQVSPVSLTTGLVMQRSGAAQALLIDSVADTLVVLKLQRRPASGSLTREFRLDDGVLAHQAAGNARDSRFELAAALLGRMGRRDAAPLLAAMAEEQGSQSLRWQSLKECLGLDSGEGFRALSLIAARPGDPLARPAEALRSQLLEQYPQLAGTAPCRG